jgi:hypothetical protein
MERDLNLLFSSTYHYLKLHSAAFMDKGHNSNQMPGYSPEKLNLHDVPLAQGHAQEEQEHEHISL